MKPNCFFERRFATQMNKHRILPHITEAAGNLSEPHCVVILSQLFLPFLKIGDAVDGYGGSHDGQY